MSRRLRLIFAIAGTAVILSTAACSSMTAPHGGDCTQTQSSSAHCG